MTIDSATRGGRRRPSAWRAVVWVVSSLALAGAGALADEPRRVAGVGFGDPLEVVEKLYPGWTRMQTGESPISFYRVEEQGFEEIRPCSVVFGFFAKRLYQVRYDCGRDAAIAALLRKRYGPPTSVNEQQEVWMGEQTAIAVNRVTKAFSFTDNALAQSMNEHILEQQRGVQH